jgi:hypothetical protein
MANNGRARKVSEQREPSRRQLRSTNGVRPLPEANASSQPASIFASPTPSPRPEAATTSSNPFQPTTHSFFAPEEATSSTPLTPSRPIETRPGLLHHRLLQPKHKTAKIQIQPIRTNEILLSRYSTIGSVKTIRTRWERRILTIPQLFPVFTRRAIALKTTTSKTREPPHQACTLSGEDLEQIYLRPTTCIAALRNSMLGSDHSTNTRVSTRWMLHTPCNARVPLPSCCTTVSAQIPTRTTSGPNAAAQQNYPPNISY